MLQKLNKYKILLLILFFLFVLCLCNNVEASTTVNFTHNNTNFSVPVDFELKNYMVVYNDKSAVNQNTYTLYNCNNSPIIFDLRNNNNFRSNTRTFVDKLQKTDINQVNVDIYMYDVNSNTFVFKKTGTYDNYCDKEFTLLYTNTEVYLRFIQSNYTYPMSCLR